MFKPTPTPSDLVQNLQSALQAFEELRDEDDHKLGEALRKDVLLILAGTANELDAHWRQSPASFLASETASEVRTQLLAKTNRAELLPVFDRHAQAWHVNQLTHMPLGPSELRKNIITRPGSFWCWDGDTNLWRGGKWASRLTLAATWCDALSVDALLAQPNGGMEADESPSTPAQALLLGAAMGAMHAQKQGRLTEFMPLLSRWWSRALDLGADPTQPDWFTIPLSQNLMGPGDWRAQPWGLAGISSSFLRSLGNNNPFHNIGHRQVPASPLQVLAATLADTCEQSGASCPGLETRKALADMLLCHPHGSIEFTCLVLSATQLSHVGILIESLSDPAAWDLSVPGPEGWDPVLTILEKLTALDNAYRRNHVNLLFQTLRDHHQATGSCLPPVSIEQVEQWQRQVMETATSQPVMTDARLGVHHCAEFLEGPASAHVWMGLSQDSSAQWERFCGLVTQALRRAPDASEGAEAGAQFRLDLKLVPASLEHAKPAAPRVRL